MPATNGATGANDRQETRKDDGLAAMLLIKSMGLVEVFMLDKPVRAFQQAYSDQPANPVVGVVAAECRQYQQWHEKFQLQRAHPAQCTRDKQQRISRQKRRDYKAGVSQ